MKKVITILVIIILLILGFLAYMGMFSNIEIAEKEVGPYEFIYEDFKGDYAKTGPVFEKIYEELLANGIEATQGLGIYYDDPDVVLKDNLKSRVGSIITEDQAKEADGRGLDYGLMTVGPFNSMVAEFPLKNMLSIMIGIQKAYPVLMEYAEEKGYEITTAYELYDYNEGKILYMFEIIK